MKNIIKINFIILVICVLVPVCVFAEETIQNTEVQNLQNQNTAEQNTTTELDGLTIQKDNLENQIQAKESEIQYIQEDMSATLLELEELSQEISDRQTEIQEIELQEVELNKYIKETEAELANLKEQYAKQEKALKSRLVAMYKVGNVEYLDVLLNSKSLSQFLSNYYYISIIAQTDTNLLNSVEEKRDSIQTLANNLEAKKLVLKASRETKEKTQIALSNMKIIKDKRVAELNEKDLALHQEIETYRQQVQDIELEIKRLALASVGAEYIGGVMAWPVPRIY